MVKVFTVFTVPLTGETLYLGPSLTTEAFLNHATVGTGLPLCEHVRTASEPRVTTRLAVTDVKVGIAVGERQQQMTSLASHYTHTHNQSRDHL